MRKCDQTKTELKELRPLLLITYSQNGPCQAVVQRGQRRLCPIYGLRGPNSGLEGVRLVSERSRVFYRILMSLCLCISGCGSSCVCVHIFHCHCHWFPSCPSACFCSPFSWTTIEAVAPPSRRRAPCNTMTTSTTVNLVQPNSGPFLSLPGRIESNQRRAEGRVLGNKLVEASQANVARARIGQKLVQALLFRPVRVGWFLLVWRQQSTQRVGRRCSCCRQRRAHGGGDVVLVAEVRQRRTTHTLLITVIHRGQGVAVLHARVREMRVGEQERDGKTERRRYSERAKSGLARVAEEPESERARENERASWRESQRTRERESQRTSWRETNGTRAN